MIRNDGELFEAIDLASEALQDIQNYLGPDCNWDNVKIKFPRGYLRTASHFRRRITFLEDKNIRDNLAYAYVQTDVYLWLLNRTDLSGIAKEMTIKSAIVLIASISETLAVAGTKVVIGKKHSFCARCDKMLEKEIISDGLCADLQWLWNARSAIHIYDINHRELEKYNMDDFNRAVLTSKQLEEDLAAWSMK